jgi:hypothetical protein
MIRWIPLILLLFTTCSAERESSESFRPAAPTYGILAEKSLDLLASFDFDTWSTMLSDSVVCYFPDGDLKTCTKLSGKAAVISWGQNYLKQSGLRSMSIENAQYIPINVTKTKREEMAGTQVIAYVSNKMVFDSGAISVRMNVLIHFDRNKLIDRYYTYYDNTPILNTLHSNL